VLATHRVQDAFGLASFHLDRASGRLVRVSFDGERPVPDAAKQPEAGAPTNVLVLREGRV